MPGPSKADLETNADLEEKVRALEGKLKEGPQNASRLATAPEVVSHDAGSSMEKIIGSLLQQQEATLKATLIASQEASHSQQEASEERFSNLLKTLRSASGQSGDSGSRTTSSASVNNRNSSAITKLHLKAPPVLEKDTDYRGFINWRKMFDRYAEVVHLSSQTQKEQIATFNEHSRKCS